jgi:hypothetical protein
MLEATRTAALVALCSFLLQGFAGVNGLQFPFKSGVGRLPGAFTC